MLFTLTIFIAVLCAASPGRSAVTVTYIYVGNHGDCEFGKFCLSLTSLLEFETSDCRARKLYRQFV